MSRSQTTTQLGREAESLAAAYLNLAGLKLRARNWRYSRLEVDLIAEDGDTLVFVEVKYRAGAGYGGAAAAVTRSKRNFLEAAAAGYLKTHKLRRKIRFDVITLTKTTTGIDLRHLRGAFQASGKYRF